jgi:hypothetical protein
MAESTDTTYETVLHALKHETDLTKLCGQLYNLTVLYREKSNWPSLEKHEQEYSKALSQCALLKTAPEKVATIKTGETVDLSGLISVKKLDSTRTFDKHVLVFLRHLA